jgi:pilus assembly protein CpaB
MRGRAIIPLVVGLGVGVFAIKMFVNVLQNAKGSNTNDMVEVVSAVADIAPTVEISESMVGVRQVPKSLAPKLAFAKKEDVIGRVAAMVIPNGSAVTANLLAPKGTLAGLAVRIPDGYRAVSIKTDEYAGVAGWLKPHARVDVVAMLLIQEGGKRSTICRTILQDVEVLAVGQDLGNAGDPNATVTKSVTLAVKPNDVPRLHLASSQTGSKLRLAMRAQKDRGIARAGTTTDNELLDGSSEANSGAEGDVSAQAQAAFLKRLLTNHSNNADQATDKGSNTSVPAGTALASGPSVENEWIVEVINGTEVQYVRFDGNSNGARRVHGKSGIPRPIRTGASPAFPVPLKPGADKDARSAPVQVLE